MSLIRKIKDYYKKGKYLLFTTPSHAQGEFIIPAARQILGEKFFKSDFSEIEGFDNLRQPEGIIKKLNTRISDIYNTKASFMLTNGSTSGMIAAMLSILKAGDKVLIARNTHISVYNGLVLTGAKPVWFMPEYDEIWGIYKGIQSKQIKDLLNKHTDIKALIITSPTYEGLFSETEEIAKICKDNNVIFIVDEAHGALLNFADFMSKPACCCAADISINSLHKTAGAPNPCALLHVSKYSQVEPDDIQSALNLINTTSPSYPLLCAIEACVNYLDSNQGRKQIINLLENIEKFKQNLSKNFKVYEGFNDPTKLLIKTESTSACAIAEFLNKKYKIEEEYSTDNAMLFITGIGTKQYKLNHLEKALKHIIEHEKIHPHPGHNNTAHIPQMHCTPAEAFQKVHKHIDKSEAAGMVCASPITLYPPGIPLILPGEVFDTNTIKIITFMDEVDICC